MPPAPAERHRKTISAAARARTGRVPAVEREAEKWLPVFLTSHATTSTPWHDDVSIKHHRAMAQAFSTPWQGAAITRYSLRPRHDRQPPPRHRNPRPRRLRLRPIPGLRPRLLHRPASLRRRPHPDLEACPTLVEPGASPTPPHFPLPPSGGGSGRGWRQRKHPAAFPYRSFRAGSGRGWRQRKHPAMPAPCKVSQALAPCAPQSCRLRKRPEWPIRQGE